MRRCRRKVQSGEGRENQKPLGTSSAPSQTRDLGRVLRFLAYRPAHIVLNLFPSI